jgi:glutathione S-transferase
VTRDADMPAGVASHEPRVHPAAVIKLYTIPGRNDLESFSPFCMKAEVYLKLAGIPYEADRSGDPRNAPKKKLPYIVDGSDTIADSGAIVAHLEKKHGEPLDKGLDDAQRAKAHLMRRTLEESLYFVALWSRWAEEEGWNKVSSRFFDPLPAPVRLILKPMIRKKVVGSAYAQGIGRHTRDEIYEHGKQDLAAVSKMMGDTFALDGKIRTIDVTIYAFVANLLRVELDTPIREFAKNDKRLVSHMERVAEALAEKGKPAETKRQDAHADAG